MGLRRLLLTILFWLASILSNRPVVGQGLTGSTIHISGGVPVVPEDLDATIDRYRFSSTLNGRVGWRDRGAFFTCNR